MSIASIMPAPQNPTGVGFGVTFAARSVSGIGAGAGAAGVAATAGVRTFDEAAQSLRPASFIAATRYVYAVWGLTVRSE